MLIFVVSIIFLILAVALLIFGIIAKVDKEDSDGYHNSRRIDEQKQVKRITKITGIILLILGLIGGAMSMVYGQDVGETVVLRNMGGSLGGVSTEAGFHIKAPWQDVIKYDIRNNVLSFMGEAEKDQFEGGSANGSAVTINDAGGASATIDIQVNYSLDPSVAKELYSDYGSQENFVKSICAVDIRAIPREVSGKFDTISILTARGDFTSAVQEALTNKWQKYGLVVEQVSIQNVVYPQSIVDKYAEAQAAEIAKATAQNDQEVKRVQAETKVIEAENQAEANRILAESLSPEVLTQKYIDALNKSDTVYVVPNDSVPVINTNK